MHRVEVENLIDSRGDYSPERDDYYRVLYSFDDGPAPEWKSVGVVWLVADVFTLFLSEIIFWQIELSIAAAAERRGDAIYDDSNRLGYFRVDKVSVTKTLLTVGEVPKFSPNPPEQHPIILPRDEFEENDEVAATAEENEIFDPAGGSPDMSEIVEESYDDQGIDSVSGGL